jgi:hypothetical protein
MHDVDLFQAALGLERPWQVVGVEFDVERRRLDLRIDFPRVPGSRVRSVGGLTARCMTPSRTPGGI